MSFWKQRKHRRWFPEQILFLLNFIAIVKLSSIENENLVSEKLDKSNSLFCWKLLETWKNQIIHFFVSIESGDEADETTSDIVGNLIHKLNKNYLKQWQFWNKHSMNHKTQLKTKVENNNKWMINSNTLRWILELFL